MARAAVVAAAAETAIAVIMAAVMPKSLFSLKRFTNGKLSGLTSTGTGTKVGTFTITATDSLPFQHSESRQVILSLEQFKITSELFDNRNRKGGQAANNVCQPQNYHVHPKLKN